MARRPELTPSGDREASFRILRRAVPYFWPKGDVSTRVRVVIALSFLALSKLLLALAPLAYGQAVDALTPSEDNPAAWLGLGAAGLIVAYSLARLFANGFQQLRNVVFAPISNAALRKLALETFNHIHALSMRYHLTRKTGALSRIMERGVKGIGFILQYLVLSIGPLFLELFFVLVIIGTQLGSVYLMILIVTFAVYILFTFKVTEWRVKLRKEMNDLDTDANQKAIDSLLNFETVKYFVSEQREASRYERAMRGYERASIKTENSLGLLNFGQTLIITSCLMSTSIYAAYEVSLGRISVGDFVIVNAFMMQITMPLNFLGSMYRNIRQALVDMQEMFELLEQPAEVVDRDDAQPLEVKEGGVAFKDVHFDYESTRAILKGVDFTIGAGKTLAIVGSSGSGKSTIGRLLFRFYDTRSGRVEIDGQDIKGVTQESLHTAIGVVPQDTVLFNDTIAYNIGYGRDGATMEDIIEAAKKAHIHEFIESLPEGYDTHVGERGLKLSGGEKQRVGIARTLLKNPPIMLLDEATSALDSQTEREILDALLEAGRGRTVLTIAHRLSTIAHADEIIVLDQGEIIERGTHEALLAKEGRYAKMWHTQAEDREAA